MKKDFDALVDEFCRICGIGRPDPVGLGTAVEVEGVDFVLSYDEQDAPDRVLVYCDYGAVPPDRQLEAYRALLETNLHNYRRDTAVFTLSPESARVICATRFRLQPLRADELRGVMTLLSRKAREWRAHFFSGLSSTAGARTTTYGLLQAGKLSRHQA